ncbi:MAG: PLP-dependent cysteine synthase family protein [Tenacibaculum sp.]
MNHLSISNTILDLVGETPLVKLHSITKKLPGKHYAKIESFNPGHSAKDRIALHIVNAAEKKGLIKKGSTIVETTSGNTGFSLAIICIIKGYKCILAVSDKSSQDKIDLLQAMGAEVHICPANVPANDARSYYQVAKKIHQKTPNSIYINQYFNPLNIEAHYLSTGPEIWRQTRAKVSHVVVASGTGGTISGVGRYLKEQNSEIKILGIDAVGSVIKKYHETREFDTSEISPYRIEGLGKNLIPSSTDFDVIDAYEKVSDKEAALKARELLKAEGIFAGYTSGAVLQGLQQYAKKAYFDNNSVVVVILPDHGSRYINKIYSDKWMQAQGFL